jgi:hypothetical protein
MEREQAPHAIGRRLTLGASDYAAG